MWIKEQRQLDKRKYNDLYDNCKYTKTFNR